MYKNDLQKTKTEQEEKKIAARLLPIQNKKKRRKKKSGHVVTKEKGTEPLHMSRNG